MTTESQVITVICSEARKPSFPVLKLNVLAKRRVYTPLSQTICTELPMPYKGKQRMTPSNVIVSTSKKAIFSPCFGLITYFPFLFLNTSLIWISLFKRFSDRRLKLKKNKKSRWDLTRIRETPQTTHLKTAGLIWPYVSVLWNL